MIAEIFVLLFLNLSVLTEKLSKCFYKLLSIRMRMIPETEVVTKNKISISIVGRYMYSVLIRKYIGFCEFQYGGRLMTSFRVNDLAVT